MAVECRSTVSVEVTCWCLVDVAALVILGAFLVWLLVLFVVSCLSFFVVGSLYAFDACGSMVALGRVSLFFECFFFVVCVVLWRYLPWL